MRFTKMHGLGNDYVYVDCTNQYISDPGSLAAAVSDRHFGVGSDGLILILPGKQADVRMRMFNADGSEGKMCGNGIRCLAKYVWDHGLSKANPLNVETLSGVKTVEMAVGSDGKVQAATVDMGEPILDAPAIPVNLPAGPVVDVPFNANGLNLKMTCVSMGNPHAVFFVDEVAAVPLFQWGPMIENHRLFPDRVNVHFVQIRSPREVTMRTWERGSGMTLACGTGASAVCVAGALTGRTQRAVLAHLPGGDLNLDWRQENNHVFMTGPAVEVFSGDWPGI